MTDSSSGVGGDRKTMPQTPAQTDAGPVRRVVAVPVTEDGQIAPGWGRARSVAVATTTDGELTDWQVHQVGWNVSHDEGTEGAHHARIAQFLLANHIDVVVVDHLGEGMLRMLTTMGIAVSAGAAGDARADLAAAAQHPHGQSSGDAGVSGMADDRE